MKGVLPFLSLLLANNCIANDSIGYLGAGGIEFKKTEDISMEKEVLTISRNLIRVEYEFLNKTSKPIKETIIFPMPLYGFDMGCSPEHSGKLEKFKVWSDGDRLTPLRTVRALLNRKDVTLRLKELGFTDEDIAEYRGIDGGCGSDKHPPEGVFAKNIDVLVKDGLMEYFVENEHAEFPTYNSRPLWKTAYFYSWEQVFPPMKKVRVVHEYVPFRGAGVWRYDFRQAENVKKVFGINNYCMTDGTIKAGNKIQIENKVDGFKWNSLQYILTTGKNWAGPIKDFTLNMQKENKNEIVSLCFDGNFKKSNELTLTSHLKDFLPKKDITAIFFYVPEPAAEFSAGGGYKPGYRRQSE